MAQENSVLVTGGAGYIGSHACKAIKSANYIPVTYDNLSTGNADAVQWGPFVAGDVCDFETLNGTIEKFKPVAVMHFAASAYVGESVLEPSKYYKNNVLGMQTLLEAMRTNDVKKLVFSSSCATYGIPGKIPVAEEADQQPINPYGRTKLVCEWMIRDYSRAYGIDHVLLRYFNVAGADPDGELYEKHVPETHLIPRILMAAYGLIENVEIFGDDYETDDGTCIRDYVHVSDLAKGHLCALNYLVDNQSSSAFNLGSGTGFSIYQILEAVNKATGKAVPVKIISRRPGDPPVLVADNTMAIGELGFQTRYSDIATIVKTAAHSIRKIHNIE